VPSVWYQIEGGTFRLYRVKFCMKPSVLMFHNNDCEKYLVNTGTLLLSLRAKCMHFK